MKAVRHLLTGLALALAVLGAGVASAAATWDGRKPPTQASPSTAEGNPRSRL
jgi:hypothetical protein